MWENILASSIAIIILVSLGILIMQLANYRNVKKRRKYFEELHQE